MSISQLNSISSSTRFLPPNDASHNIRGTSLNEAINTPAQIPIETHTADVHSFRRTERSSTLEELQKHPLFGLIWQPPPEPPSPLETTRSYRLAILAREFEGAELTREDEARLAILTQRLRRLSPKITAKSWTIAEEELTKLEEVSSQIESISLRYGL